MRGATYWLLNMLSSIQKELGVAQMPPTCCHKKNAMSMLASTWPSFRHDGILQFANGKLRHKNVSSICWRQGVFLATDYGGPKNYGGLVCQ
jgi:hypothetical protein